MYNQEQIILVLIMILLDIITGVIQAFKHGDLNSSLLRSGLFNKLGEVIAIVCAYIFQYIPKAFEIEIDIPLLTGVAVYIVLMEMVSVIENLCNINEHLYALFQPYLAKLKGNDTHE